MNLIKNLLRGLIVMPAILISLNVIVYGQDVDVVLSSDPGGSEIFATRQIILLPGFSLAPGRNFRMYIDRDPSSVTMGPPWAPGMNYIMRTTYLKPYTSEPGAPKASDRMHDLQYYDGLGRPDQTVEAKANSDYSDIVTIQGYDGFGRPDRTYLPYAAGSGGTYRWNGVAEQAAFYNNPSTPDEVRIPAVGDVTPSFSRTVYEPSPLNRVKEQGFAGQPWQPAASRENGGRTVVTEHASNNTTGFGSIASTRRVSRYSVGYDQQGNPVLALQTPYAAGQLYVEITRDENWKNEDGRAGTQEEYTDKQGQVVLRRTFNRNSSNVLQMLSTYYVYDDFGNLCYVLPPGLSPDREQASPISATDLDRFAYQYRYDMRQRLSQKKLPGNTYWHKMIYNSMEWLVMEQDGRSSGSDPYNLFYKYDAMGRLVMKGTQKNGDFPWLSTQQAANGQANHWEEVSTASGNIQGYSNRSMPVLPSTASLYEVMEVNYYDRYTGIPGLPNTQTTNYSTQVHGLLTAKKVRVQGTQTYLWTVYYYDSDGRVSREWSQHYRGGSVSGTNTVDYSYNFVGQPVQTVQTLTSTGQPTLRTTSKYSYDHRSRLVDTRKQVSYGTVNGAEVLISRNSYNQMGQLSGKGLHSTDGGSTFAEELSYRYNARGWLNSSGSPLFSQQLQYEQAPMGGTAQYNGNISGQSWSRNGSAAGSFVYSYDRLDRLTSGIAGDGKRELLEYDLMGNITALTRDSNPKWQYAYTGNRLNTISFGSTSYNYSYEAVSGNMTRDGRNANNISYNYLNLPQQVSGSRAVSYTYDGTGNKLRAINAGTARDYVAGTEWSGGQLELVHMEEGRLLRSGDQFSYEYVLKDHLGNARAGFHVRTNGTIERDFRSDYYPFGMAYDGSYPSPKNNYLYNGKELQEGLGQYDYGARHYDPVIGRWGVVDPLAENHYEQTPYNYVLGNPIRYSDFMGLDTLDVNTLDMSVYREGEDVVQLGEAQVNSPSRTSGERRASRIGMGMDPFTYLDGRPDYEARYDYELNQYYRRKLSSVWDPQEAIYEGVMFAVSGGIANAGAKLALRGLGSLLGRVAAKTGSQLLLKPGAANLTQKGLDHIVARHWFTSGAKGAGKFAEGTTGTGLKSMMQTTTTQGIFRANTAGRAGTIAEYNFGRVIGTTSSGGPASNLRVVIGTNGNVITAFPF